MRKAKRNETPSGFNRQKHPIEKKAVAERIDLVESNSASERDRAKAALAMMKELEKKKQKGMVSVRLDSKTVIRAHKSRINDLVERYHTRQP